jgi:hypothetical protein
LLGCRGTPLIVIGLRSDPAGWVGPSATQQDDTLAEHPYSLARQHLA